METSLQQLYPPPVRDLHLKNLYLAHNVRKLASPASVFVYANFVTSLDGRIAIASVNSKDLTIPKSVANERDWRLFQELAAQADIIISSGRYLRDWAAGKAQEILQVDDPRFADLRQWRQQQGLPVHPDIAILSRSLEFPLPEVLTAEGRRMIVFTAGKPDRQRVKEIESKTGQVFVTGDETVDGHMVIKQLQNLGYRIIYSAAGPKVLHTLLAANVLDRLYLTITNRILGGAKIATITDGPLLSPYHSLQISSIYLDQSRIDGLNQLFLAFDRMH